MSPGMEKAPLTFEAAAALLDYLVEKLEQAQADEAASTPKSGMAWGNLQQCAAHFGMSRDTMEGLLPDLVERGKVRVLRGAEVNGKRPLKRYNLHDLETALG